MRGLVKALSLSRAWYVVCTRTGLHPALVFALSVAFLGKRLLLYDWLSLSSSEAKMKSTGLPQNSSIKSILVRETGISQGLSRGQLPTPVTLPALDASEVHVPMTQSSEGGSSRGGGHRRWLGSVTLLRV